MVAMLYHAEITPLVEAKAKRVVSRRIWFEDGSVQSVVSGRLRLCVLLHRAATVDADADNPKQVLRDLEPVFRGHRILNRLEFG